MRDTVALAFVSSSRPMQITDFPFITSDKVRYNDTDRQGHVNNAVFATFMELARVEVLHSPLFALQEPNASFVVAKLTIDYRAEIHWPGEVHIGTRVSKVGNSSVEFENGIFQNGTLCGLGRAVVVLVDKQLKKSRPISESARAKLLQHMAESNPKQAQD